MYFSADAGDGFHIWRQRFPKGVPEQITFGPTEEEGIAVAPDGHGFGILARPTRGGSPVSICDVCNIGWSHDRKFLYVRFRGVGDMAAERPS